MDDYTAAEAAAILGLDRDTIRTHIRRGAIRGEKRGRDWFIAKDELERFQRERRKRGEHPKKPQPDMKRCTKCDIEQPKELFHTKDKATGRLFSWCKACHYRMTEERKHRDYEKYLDWRRDHYARHRERERERNAAWRADNLEAARARERAWYAENQPQIRARKQITRNRAQEAEYRADHVEQIREKGRRLYQRDRERISQRNKRWRRANPDRSKAIGHRRRARLTSNGGHWTAAEWQALKAHFGYRCLMCGKCEPEIVLSVDHVVPISLGGSNNIANIQPLCKPCNSSKGAQILDLRDKPFVLQHDLFDKFGI